MSCGSRDAMARIRTPEEEQLGYQIASLRWFLRFYKRLRPEVVTDLQSRVLPFFPGLLSGGMREQEAYRNALESWLNDFGLPISDAMKAEAYQTLLHTPPQPGRCVFYWDFCLRMLNALKKESSSHDSFSYPFIFRARGWTPGEESIEEARLRLKRDFEEALREHAATWYEAQRIGASLPALLKLDREHVRHLLWLACKQARRVFPSRTSLTDPGVRLTPCGGA